MHLWALAPKVLESKSWQWGVLKAGKAYRAINVNFSNRSKISSVVIKDLQATSNREFSLLVFGDFIVKRKTKEIMGLAGFFFQLRQQCWDFFCWRPMFSSINRRCSLRGTALHLVGSLL